MSLAPAVLPGIEGVEGKRLPLPSRCCAPGCISVAQHGHHMWPRSFLRGQPQDWVRLPNGEVISNVVPLCVRHHNDVTGDIGGHRARIEYSLDSFFWLRREMQGLGQDMREVWVNDGPLTEGMPARPVRKEGHPKGTRAHAHIDLEEGTTCPSCGYSKPVKREPGPKRKAKSWSITVPDDNEDGAEVLESLVESLAVYLPLDETKITKGVTRYHVVTAALVFALTNVDTLVADLGGEARDAA